MENITSYHPLPISHLHRLTVPPSHLLKSLLTFHHISSPPLHKTASHSPLLKTLTLAKYKQTSPDIRHPTSSLSLPSKEYKYDMTLTVARVLVGAVFLHLALGTIYSWGNSSVYVTSYLRVHDGHVTSHDTLQVFSCALIGQALFMSVGGHLEKRWGPRWTGVFASFILFAGTYLSSLCTKTAQLSCAQFLYGIGIGIGYIPPLSCGYRHLPSSKGLVSGIIVAGFGAGSFVFNFVVTGYVNPNDEKLPDGEDYYPTDSDVTNKVPAMYRLLAVCYLGLGVVGSLMMTDPVEESREEKLPLITEEEGSEAAAAKKKKENDSSMTTSEMIRTSTFYILVPCFFMCGTGGMYVSATYKNFGEEYLKSQADSFFATVGSVGSLCNGLSRVFWGALADKIGVYNTLVLMAVLFPTTLFVYTVSISNPNAYFVTVAILFWCYGGNFSLFPTITADIFGALHHGTNYGVVFISFGCITAIGIYIISTSTISYEEVNYIVVGVGFIGAALAGLLKGTRR